jgi:hypothetical protein
MQRDASSKAGLRALRTDTRDVRTAGSGAGVVCLLRTCSCACRIPDWFSPPPPLPSAAAGSRGGLRSSAFATAATSRSLRWARPGSCERSAASRCWSRSMESALIRASCYGVPVRG